MREQGLITAVSGKYATVRIDKKDECSKCGMCLFPKGASSIELSAINGVGAKEGDVVTIDTAKDGKLLGAALVFLVPLLIIALSMVIGLVVVKNELVSLIMSVALIAIWYAVLALIDKKLKKSKGFIPVIISIEKNTSIN